MSDDGDPAHSRDRGEKHYYRKGVYGGYKKPCNARIEQLARPNRNIVLGTWLNYANVLSPEKQENVRQLLQEMYSMTPEDTEKYFALLREVARREDWRRRLKKRLRRRQRIKCRLNLVQDAYRLFKKILMKGMMYAYKYETPPFVTVRLRNIADVILEQLCDLRDVEVPNRDENDKLSQFLITVADWMAIGVEYIFYEIQVNKNLEMDKIEAEEILRQNEMRCKKEEEDALKVASSIETMPQDTTTEFTEGGESDVPTDTEPE